MTALTPHDIKQVREIVREEIQSEVSSLITKEEFFTWMEKLYTELKVITEKMKAMNNKATKKEIEIEKLKP